MSQTTRFERVIEIVAELLTGFRVGRNSLLSFKHFANHPRRTILLPHDFRRREFDAFQATQFFPEVRRFLLLFLPSHLRLVRNVVSLRYDSPAAPTSVFFVEIA